MDGYETAWFSTGNSNRVANLPTAADNVGRELKISKTDSGTGYVTITAEGAETINGVTSIVVELQFCGLHIKCTGSGWIVLGTIGECEIQTIGSAVELVYVKIISSSGDSAPAHGVDIDKIITMIPILSYSIYRYSPNYYDCANNWFPLLTATTVSLLPTGVFAGQNWSVEIKYYI